MSNCAHAQEESMEATTGVVTQLFTFKSSNIFIYDFPLLSRPSHFQVLNVFKVCIFETARYRQEYQHFDKSGR